MATGEWRAYTLVEKPVNWIAMYLFAYIDGNGLSCGLKVVGLLIALTGLFETCQQELTAFPEQGARCYYCDTMYN